MEHFRVNDKEGNPCFAIPEEEYIALTHYFGETTIDVLKCMKKIGRTNWGYVEDFINQLPYKQEGIE